MKIAMVMIEHHRLELSLFARDLGVGVHHHHRYVKQTVIWHKMTPLK
jgi:hypothetical protein